MSTPIEHLDIPLEERHAPHNWEYADATAREAATGFVPEDIGRQALQLDDFSRWTLIDDDPATWQSDAIATAGAGGLGDVVGPASSVDNALARFDSTTGKLIQNSNLTLPDDAATTEVGYLNIPQNSQSGDYTLVIADRGKHIFHPVGDNNPRTFTIPANASVAFPVGTAITFVNKINVLSIAITSDTLTWAEDGSTGTRALAANGICTALKITSSEWLVSGTGLS
jgi:hypothetical protein